MQKQPASDNGHSAEKSGVARVNDSAVAAGAPKPGPRQRGTSGATPAPKPAPKPVSGSVHAPESATEVKTALIPAAKNAPAAKPVPAVEPAAGVSTVSKPGPKSGPKPGPRPVVKAPIAEEKQVPAAGIAKSVAQLSVTTEKPHPVKSGPLKVNEAKPGPLKPLPVKPSPAESIPAKPSPLRSSPADVQIAAAAASTDPAATPAGGDLPVVLPAAGNPAAVPVRSPDPETAAAVAKSVPPASKIQPVVAGNDSAAVEGKPVERKVVAGGPRKTEPVDAEAVAAYTHTEEPAGRGQESNDQVLKDEPANAEPANVEPANEALKPKDRADEAPATVQGAPSGIGTEDLAGERELTAADGSTKAPGVAALAPEALTPEPMTSSPGLPDPEPEVALPASDVKVPTAALSALMLVSFVLEVAMLGAVAVGAMGALPLTPVVAVLVTVVPLMVFWGLFMSPKATFRLAPAVHTVLAHVLFAAGAVLLVLAGQPVLAVAMGVLTAVSLALTLLTRGRRGTPDAGSVPQQRAATRKRNSKGSGRRAAR